MPRKPKPPEAHPLDEEMNQVSSEIIVLRRLINVLQADMRCLFEQQGKMEEELTEMRKAVKPAKQKSLFG